MRILFIVDAPKQIYMFNIIGKLLERKGHSRLYLIRAPLSGVTPNIKIARALNLPYESYGSNFSGLIGKMVEMLYNDYDAINIVRKISQRDGVRPDIVVGDALLGHLAKLLGIPSIAFVDGSSFGIYKFLYNIIYFSDIFVTPKCNILNIKKSVIKYNGIQELIYLSPKYFKPDPKVLDIMEISKNDPFIILRLSAYQMSHDIGLKGLIHRRRDIISLIKKLKQYAKVFISSEKPLEKVLHNMMLSIPPHLFHSALYFASLFIGDTAASVEAAVVGTPSIQISPIDSRGRSIFEKYETFRYVANTGLMKIISVKEFEKISAEAENILQDPYTNKKIQQRKLIEFLNRHIDVASFGAQLIESYSARLKQRRC